MKFFSFKFFSFKEHKQALSKQLLLLLFTFFASMGLFLISWKFDNKYTLQTTQPIGGILFFDPDIFPMTHLINGWQYYRGEFLEPEDFSRTAPIPDGYLSVGQYPGMDAGQTGASPHGSATYRLLLSLPENEAAIHSGSVTFEAAGNTTLLLAVSDWSYLYSGLVYPPALGTPVQVGTLLEQKFAWSLSVTVLALLLGLIQAVLFLLLKNRRTLYSSMIGISFAVSVCSPAIHRLITTDIVPFYNIELFCRYTIYGSAVLLVNHLYGKKTNMRTAVSGAAILFPSFEPIRFGWFSETAGLIFVLITSFLMFRDSFLIYKEGLLLSQEKKRLEMQNELPRRKQRGIKLLPLHIIE